VADDLRRRIEAGEFLPGAPLPSLLALVDEYGVSRSTAAKAVAALRDAGLVESVRGWGTFVRQK
jgi:GntR family transcriptional regulator